jgi:hypothetical protein
MNKIEMTISNDDDKILLYDLMKNLKKEGYDPKIEFYDDKVIIY